MRNIYSPKRFINKYFQNILLLMLIFLFNIIYITIKYNGVVIVVCVIKGTDNDLKVRFKSNLSNQTL